MRRALIFPLLFMHHYLVAQTVGGSSVFNFLSLPNAPQLTALGGINISNITNDLGVSFHNPSLLRAEMHGQVTMVFNNMYAGVKAYHLAAAYTSSKLLTNFSAGIHYLDYGSIQQTDAAGNVFGTFRPVDYVVQVSASRQYLQHWYYGGSFKLINSNYGLYRSNGVAMDAGVSFYDSLHQWQASLLMRNMGFQLKQYAGSAADALPFDLLLGITKRLQKAPIQFSLTAHHLQQFNIRYNDTAFNNENGFNNIRRGHQLDKLFRHLIFATQFYIGEKLEISTGYNYLRRKELNIDNTANGLTGFSLGLGVLFKKISLRYARGYYQNNTGYNQFGLSMQFW